MDHNMVLSYDYINWNRRRRRTNAPPLQANMMAMAVHQSDTVSIDRRMKSRAFIKAAQHRHQVTTRSVLPGGHQGDSKQNKNAKYPPLCWPFWWPWWCAGNTAHITQWRWFVAFLKATKHRHWASTHSDITQSDMLTPEFGGIFHELTFWPLITIGGWHIKLTGTT